MPRTKYLTFENFGCAVYVPIAPPQRTKMGPQRKMGIYVSFESPYIIKYLEPSSGDLFTARFDDCHFNEAIFPSLWEEKVDRHNIELTWKAKHLEFLDPKLNSCEHEVQRIIHLQRVANQLPDAFTDTNKVTKSHIPAANVPARLEIPKDIKNGENEINTRRKRGRPLGSKDMKPRKKKKIEEIKGKEVGNEKDKKILRLKDKKKKILKHQ